MNGHNDQVIELTNANQPDQDELQPTNCYECRDSQIENVPYQHYGADRDMDVCACNNPDFPAPDTIHTRYKREYDTLLGKWLEPGSWKVPGDRQVKDFMVSLPNLCPLRNSN